jgi:hypothetical protein
MAKPTVNPFPGAALVILGFAMAAYGLSAQFAPRSNAEDDIAWVALNAGTFLIGFGAVLPYCRPIFAILAGYAVLMAVYFVQLILVWFVG